MTNVERWLPIVGYEGHYEVSDLGRVRSVDHIAIFADGRSRMCAGRIRALATLQSGHKTVSLHRNNKSVTKLVHRLVLETFTGPCPPGLECCHGNDIPGDNRITNLSWGTRSDNLHDMVRNGKHWGAKKVTCPYGHVLRQPNLTAAGIRRGSRDCLTCSRAFSNASYAKRMGKSYVLSVSMTQHYSTIMAGAA